VVSLEVAVVVAGGGEVAVSELLLDVEQRVVSGQPRGCGSVAK
jgi:hypothetical protein